MAYLVLKERVDKLVEDYELDEILMALANLMGDSSDGATRRAAKVITESRVVLRENTQPTT